MIFYGFFPQMYLGLIDTNINIINTLSNFSKRNPGPYIHSFEQEGNLNNC